MKIAKYLYVATMALALGACSDTEVEYGCKRQGMEPVLLSAGNIGAAVTRASVAYLPKDSRFVCSMFFHAGANDTDSTDYYSSSNPLASNVNMATAWLKINNEYGNALYCDSTYQAATSTDNYGFDESAKVFFWQNRLNHVFLALADYHQLSNDSGYVDGTLKMFPDLTEKYNNKYMKAYDLTRDTNDSTITQQPDPILAVDLMKPAGATPEANRVNLFFKHQFAQVQVNLKNSQDTTSVVIGNSQIEKVELLGVSEMAYVPYCINADGTLPAVVADTVNIDDEKYKDTKKSNPYGSSFSLFVRKNTTSGYLKTFEGIAFGTLQRIRVTWKEPNNDITHTAILNSVIEQPLESGKKYIYNIELRRSSIAQVTPQVVDWGMDDKDYSADGTISY